MSICIFVTHAVSRQVHDDRNDGEVATTTTLSTTSTTPIPITTQKATTTTAQPRPTRATSRTTTPSDDYDYYNEVDNADDQNANDGSRKKTTIGYAEEITTTQRTVTINYDGDYDTVDDHRRKLNVTSGDPSSNIPDICQGHFDAVSVLRNELFFFKDQVKYPMF